VHGLATHIRQLHTELRFPVMGRVPFSTIQKKEVLMKLTRKLLTLSAIAALSFGLAACDDDSDGKTTDPGTTTQDPGKTDPGDTCKAACVENVLTWCDAEGKPQTKTCNADEKCNALFGESGCLPMACTSEGQKKCTGDKTYLTCTADKEWGQEQTCSADLTCIDDDCRVCKTGAKICKDGKSVTCRNYDWGTPEDCAYGCDDGTGQCKSNETVVKDNSTMYDKKCSCTGQDCTKTITGKQLRAALHKDKIDELVNKFAPLLCTEVDTSSTAAIAGSGIKLLAVLATGCGLFDASCRTCTEQIKNDVDTIIGMIPDSEKAEDSILVPNYFFDGVKEQCGKDNEGNDIAIPEGMNVACLYDSKIQPPEYLRNILTSNEFKDVLDKVKNASVLDMTDFLKENMHVDVDKAKVIEMLDKVKEFAVKDGPVDGILKDGIPFKANEGTCLLANIDLQLDVTKEKIFGMVDISAMIDMDKVKAMLNDNLNTVDHVYGDECKGNDKTKCQGVVNTVECPTGGAALDYALYSKTEVGGSYIGSADIHFDMCLKNCNTDDDCRDDFKCVSLPYGTDEAIAAANECLALEKTCTDGKDACHQKFVDCKNCTGEYANIEGCKVKSIKNVCFDKANIDYFTNMTEMFKPADGTQN